MATPPQKESRANALAWSDDMAFDLQQSLPPRDSVTTPRKEKLVATRNLCSISRQCR